MRKDGGAPPLHHRCSRQVSLRNIHLICNLLTSSVVLVWKRVVSSPSSHGYRFSGMNWTAAQSFCRKQHSDLASIRNESENQQVQQLVPAGTKVWTGLYRGGWKWSAGSLFSFSYWKSTEPNNNNNNENCVLATFDALGKWEDCVFIEIQSFQNA
uniref:C-type lectin domain-containing protein n=1 Tax=Xiphophorus maculatus TaxID=8083 RepID=A0A3B5Q6G5_XIPMA